MEQVPPTEQNPDEDDCPICGSSMKYPALSRFDNKTYVCPECGECEGTGFLLSYFDDDTRIMLQAWDWVEYHHLSAWQAHCVRINAIAGSRRGFIEKRKEAFALLEAQMEEKKDEEEWPP